jgi:hypothetical protein
MACTLSFLISSESKKKEPRYVCPCEAKASLRLKILMTFGSKRRTQIFFSFRSKVPANEPPPGEGLRDTSKAFAQYLEHVYFLKGQMYFRTRD